MKKLIIAVLVLGVMATLAIGIKNSVDANEKIRDAESLFVIGRADRSIVEFSDRSLWILVQRNPDFWNGRGYVLCSLGWKMTLARLMNSGLTVTGVYEPKDPRYPIVRDMFLKQ